MSKKTIILCVALILALTLGLGGTLAYLTDTDADVNVMVMGDVKIAQNEQQRVDQGDHSAGVEAFEQYKSLIPAIYIDGQPKTDLTVGDYVFGMRNDTMKNYVDKLVSVTNTGSNDAFVRTIIAVPTGEIDYVPETASDNWLHYNVIADEDSTPANGWYYGVSSSTLSELKIVDGEYPAEMWPAELDIIPGVEIDGIEYDLLVATNKNIVKPGETTAPNLVGLYLDSRVDKDEDGYFIKLTPAGEKHRIKIDDPANVKILVASQAVQSEGFEEAGAWYALDAAFGDISSTNHPWVNGMPEVGTPGDKWPDNNPPAADSAYVHNEAELKAALNNPEVTNILFGDNITVDETIDVNGNVEINMNGFNLDASQTAGWPFEITDGGSLTINAENQEIKLGASGLACVPANNDAMITLNGGNYTGAMENGAFIKQVGSGDVTINLNDVKFSDNSDDSYILDVAQANVNVNGGEYISPRGMQVLRGEVNISDAKITTTDNSTKNYAVVTYGKANIENCEITSAYYAIATGNGGEINVKDSSVTSENFYALYWFTSGGTYNLENTDLESNGPYNNADYYVNKVSAGNKAVLNIDGKTVYQKGG